MDEMYARTGIEANSFGKYRLIAGLGSGGMATVHLAVVHGPAGFNKLVVLKQIRPELAEDPEILGMFLDEAQLAARLSHPNVVQTNEVGQEGDRRFLAMEYLDGQPLSRIKWRLQGYGGLPLVLHLRVIADLLAGLHYLHELADYDGSPLGLVHRDVTPQNVFITYDGGVKIVDFGIAKAETALTQTRVGIIKGKVAYMAPEQARGEPVDRRADIFAVGVMLWEAATGARPWVGLPPLTVLKRVLAGHFPAPRSIKPEIPPQLEAIILKALAHDRRDRHATAAELQVELEAYIQTTGERLQRRELGTLLGLHFQPERARIKAVIEEQLRAPGAEPARLPVLDEPTPSGAGPMMGGEGEETSSGGPPAASGTRAVPRARPPVARGASTTMMARPRPQQRRGLFVPAGALAIGAAVLIAAAGLSLKWASAGTSAVSATAPWAVAASVAEGLAEAAPASSSATVEVRFSASPPEARMFLDDAPLEGSAFKGNLPRDGAIHRLRVEAAGFVDRAESFVLDQDRSFEVVLVRQGTLGPLPAPTGRRPHPRARTLDSANPYGR
jgi:serine/threonine-protein kinase